MGQEAVGKDISKGLGTRHPLEACKRRDLALGDIRRLQYEISDAETFSLSSAMERRSHSVAINETSDDPRAAEAVELVLSNKLEDAHSRGRPPAPAPTDRSRRNW